jgi:hypothetical protein
LDRLQTGVSEPDGTEEASSCQFDWFFGNENASDTDCPRDVASEVDGLVQHFGEGVLIGFFIPDSGDARFYVLKNDGSYLDIPGDWETSPVSFGSCPFPTVIGFQRFLPFEDTPEEVIGCPAGEVLIEALDYQTSDSSAEYVAYVGTSQGEVFRLAAPSSVPGTEGEWRRIP